MKPLKGAKAAASFDSFLAVAEEINKDVEKVKKNVEEMKTVQKRILTEPAKSERDKFQVSNLLKYLFIFADIFVFNISNVQAKHNDLVEENKKLGHSLQRLIKVAIIANMIIIVTIVNIIAITIDVTILITVAITTTSTPPPGGAGEDRGAAEEGEAQ